MRRGRAHGPVGVPVEGLQHIDRSELPRLVERLDPEHRVKATQRDGHALEQLHGGANIVPGDGRVGESERVERALPASTARRPVRKMLPISLPRDVDRVAAVVKAILRTAHACEGGRECVRVGRALCGAWTTFVLDRDARIHASAPALITNTKIWTLTLLPPVRAHRGDRSALGDRCGRRCGGRAAAHGCCPSYTAHTARTAPTSSRPPARGWC